MTNNKLTLYNDMLNGFNGQCIIIYTNDNTNHLIHTHNSKDTLTALKNIKFDDILYICCQKGYSILKKESNYAIDTDIGTIPFSSYDNKEHIKFYEYLDNIYAKYGVVNYED